MRSTPSRFLHAIAAVGMLLLPALQSWAQPVSTETKKLVLEKMTATIDERAYAAGVHFDKLAEHLKKNSESIDHAVDQRTFVTAVNKSLKEFGISHIRLLSPQTATNRRSTDRIGVGISTRKIDDGLLVQEVVEGGPAEAAGLRIGDLILKIDGEEATSAETLGGAEGSKVTVLVRREQDKQEEVIITRGKFSTRKPETLVLLDDHAAVLRIPTFSVGYDSKNIEAIFKKARQSKVDYLVLDLRANGGGRVSNLNHLLSFFFERDTEIGTNISRVLAKRFKEETGGDDTDPVAIAKWTKSNFRVRAQQEDRYTGKVAVLIDRGSASASEICAAALRELRSAPLVGASTAGAVLVSSHLRLVEGYEVQIPLSDYVTIKNRRLEQNRLKPDVEIAGARAKDGGMDSVVAKALELLKAPSNAEAPAAEQPKPMEPVGN